MSTGTPFLGRLRRLGRSGRSGLASQKGCAVPRHDGALEFHELDEPTPSLVADLAAHTAERVIKLLEKAGKSVHPEFQDDEADDFVQRQPALASLYAAAARGLDLTGDRAGQSSLRLLL